MYLVSSQRYYIVSLVRNVHIYTWLFHVSWESGLYCIIFYRFINMNGVISMTICRYECIQTILGLVCAFLLKTGDSLQNWQHKPVLLQRSQTPKQKKIRSARRRHSDKHRVLETSHLSVEAFNILQQHNKHLNICL